MKIDFCYRHLSGGVPEAKFSVDTEDLSPEEAGELTGLLPPNTDLKALDGRELRTEGIRDEAWYELSISSDDFDFQAGMDNIAMPQAFGKLMQVLRERAMSSAEE